MALDLQQRPSEYGYRRHHTRPETENGRVNSTNAAPYFRGGLPRGPRNAYSLPGDSFQKRDALMSQDSPRPVFIIGTSRSGTSLMVQILNRHPQVMIAAETHYFDDLRPRLKPSQQGYLDPISRVTVKAYFAKLEGSAYGLDGLERNQTHAFPVDVESEKHIGADEVFRKFCLDQAVMSGKDITDLRIWGEKTPRHVFCLSEITAAFPDARFIFMQRDPRAVIASYRDWQNHFIDPDKAEPRLRQALMAESRRVQRSFSIGIAALMWRAAQKAAWRGRKRLGPERLYIQKFEDLLAEPHQQISLICDFLGIFPIPEMQKVERINSSYSPRSEGGIDENAARAWENRLADRESWIIEKICAGPMVNGGYVPIAKHPIALMVEVFRTCARIPVAFITNLHRMGSPLTWVLRRLGIDK
jgi:hypothetical protein